MMKNFTIAAFVAGFAFIGAAPIVQAASFDFPSSSSTETTSGPGLEAGQTGRFFFVEHTVSETFTDPVLTSVEQVDLSLGLVWNVLAETIGIGVSLNGTTLGSFTVAPADPLGPINLSYTGLDIAGIGAGKDYTMMLFVDAPVSLGAGAIAFALDQRGSLTLIGAADVPIPAALPLMLGGLGLFGLIRRRA